MTDVFIMEFSSTLGTLDFDVVGALGGSYACLEYF